MPENYFDARIARTYEAKWPELFDPAAIEPVVSFLARRTVAGLVGFGVCIPAGPAPGLR